VHYVPVPWQPYYRARYGEHSFPGASAYYNRCLSLPLFVGMTEADVDRVVDVLGEATSAA
jgi:dTDP-4-amino-4,6-dideoxygalactose transaminase